VILAGKNYTPEKVKSSEFLCFEKLDFLFQGLEATSIVLEAHEKIKSFFQLEFSSFFCPKNRLDLESLDPYRKSRQLLPHSDIFFKNICRICSSYATAF
jgi:hypothetical protein